MKTGEATLPILLLTFGREFNYLKYCDKSFHKVNNFAFIRLWTAIKVFIFILKSSNFVFTEERGLYITDAATLFLRKKGTAECSLHSLDTVFFS